MGMGSSNVIKGTFTCPDSGTSYTVDFGKTLNDYLIYIEMTEASKSVLIASGENGYRTFVALTKRYLPVINNLTMSDYKFMFRYDPTANTSSPTYSTALPLTCNDSSFTISISSFGTAYSFYKGCSYNYVICPLD